MAAIVNLQKHISIRGTKTQCEAYSGSLEEIAFAYATDSSELGVYTNGAWVWIGGAASGITRSGSTTDDHLAVWNGSDADSIKDGGVVPAGVSGFWGEVLLDTVVGAGGAANFDLGSIAAGFKKIEILVTARIDTTTSASLIMQVNGDTTATNYQQANLLEGTSGATAFANDNRIGYVMPSDQTANRFAFNKITIYDYDSTAMHKNAICEASYHPSTGAGYLYWITWLWRNTAAINQITLVPGAGNFAQYSHCVIIGYKTY